MKTLRLNAWEPHPNGQDLCLTKEAEAAINAAGIYLPCSGHAYTVEGDGASFPVDLIGDEDPVVVIPLDAPPWAEQITQYVLSARQNGAPSGSLIQVSATPKCDFCCAGNVPVEPRSCRTHEIESVPGVRSIDNWAVCADCAPLVDADAKDELAARCYHEWQRRNALPPGMEFLNAPDAIRVIKEVQAGFFGGRTEEFAA